MEANRIEYNYLKSIHPSSSAHLLQGHSLAGAYRSCDRAEAGYSPDRSPKYHIATTERSHPADGLEPRACLLCGDGTDLHTTKYLQIKQILVVYLFKSAE